MKDYKLYKIGGIGGKLINCKLPEDKNTIKTNVNNCQVAYLRQAGCDDQTNKPFVCTDIINN